MKNGFTEKIKALNAFAKAEEVELEKLKEQLVQNGKFEEAKVVAEISVIVNQLKSSTANESN